MRLLTRVYGNTVAVLDVSRLLSLNHYTYLFVKKKLQIVGLLAHAGGPQSAQNHT